MQTAMRAVQVLGDKDSPELTLTTSIPVPVPVGGELLIRVAAAGITADEISWPELYQSNRIPGHDVAGTVAALGPDYRGDLQAGDQVFAMIRAATRGGGQADYVAINGSEVAPKPSRLSMSEAAALPIPFLTAWEALHQHAVVGNGTKVLVTGAGGAVGSMLVQVASQILGADVTALASSRSHQHLQALGARICVDYAAAGWEASLGDGMDVVIDTVGGTVYKNSWRCLKQGGTMVTVADPPPSWAFNGGEPDEIKGNPDAKYVYFIVTASGEALSHAAKLFSDGTLKQLPVVEFTAERALEAWKYARTRGRDGKAIIQFD